MPQAVLEDTGKRDDIVDVILSLTDRLSVEDKLVNKTMAREAVLRPAKMLSYRDAAKVFYAITKYVQKEIERRTGENRYRFAVIWYTMDSGLKNTIIQVSARLRLGGDVREVILYTGELSRYGEIAPTVKELEAKLNKIIEASINEYTCLINYIKTLHKENTS